MTSNSPKTSLSFETIQPLRIRRARQSVWLLAVLFLAPLELGAKGCDVGVVGTDREPVDEPKTCGTIAGLACDEGEFCEFARDALCGAADAAGVCKPTPEVCADIYSPVCGCDDLTYGNACEANAAGVSVAREGECDGAGTDRACGGLLGLTCRDGEFCNYPKDAICGFADATGVCTATPQACDTIYLPVCGCDGVTYGNACSAHVAGVSVAEDGECEGGSKDRACGGLVGLKCEDGEYCNYPAEAMCGFADATGVCTPTPEACTREYDPVCGCDDMTYNNPCAAAVAGVSVKAPGACARR